MSRTGCRGGRATRHAHDRGCRPWSASPSRGSRARPWRRWGCRPWRGCRRSSRAGPDREDRERLGRQAVEPLAGGHRLVGRRVVAEAAPVALVLDRLVGDRPLHDQDERLQLAAVGLEEPLDEVVRAAHRTALEVDERPVHGDLRQPGEGAQGDLLDAGLGGRGQRDGVAVAAQAGVDPEDVHRRRVGRAETTRDRDGHLCLDLGHSLHHPQREAARGTRAQDADRTAGAGTAGPRARHSAAGPGPGSPAWRPAWWRDGARLRFTGHDQ